MNLFTIRTPGFVLAEMRSVDTMLRSLSTDVLRDSESGQVTGFAPSFAAFIRDWQDFYDDHASGVGGWWSRGTSAVYDKVLEYKAMAIRWRDEFVRRGGRPSGVVPEPSGGNVWPYVVGGALLAGAVALAFGGAHEE